MTNKPEVVAWRWFKPTVNDHGETLGGIWKVDGVPSFLPWWINEPLIRLAEYEKCHTALRDCQLENSFLREDNQRLRHENAFMLRLINEQMNRGEHGKD